MIERLIRYLNFEQPFIIYGAGGTFCGVRFSNEIILKRYDGWDIVFSMAEIFFFNG